MIGLECVVLTGYGLNFGVESSESENLSSSPKLSLENCVALGKILDLSRPQFHHANDKNDKPQTGA